MTPSTPRTESEPVLPDDAAAPARRARARATPPTRRPTASSRPSARPSTAQALRAARARARMAGGGAAAVGLRARAVLRVGVLLLRLQQDHHQAPRARGANTCDALETRDRPARAPSSGAAQPVSQLHFGGGTPTFLSDDELARLMAHAARAPSSSRRAPRSRSRSTRAPSTPSAWRHLRAAGLQPPELRRAGLRPATCSRPCTACSRSSSVRDADAGARALGFESINADLIYGLPQADARALRAHGRAGGRAAARPHRAVRLRAPAAALQAAAPHRRRRPADAPSSASRMLARRHRRLHRPRLRLHRHGPLRAADDALAVAKRQGRLHRNFQGYSTQPDCDLIALGVSAIGRMGATYSQNAKTLPEYYDALRQRRSCRWCAAWRSRATTWCAAPSSWR